MLELRLFGSGQVQFLEEPLPGFPSYLPYRLLCYLVLNRHQSQPREQLATLFWGDYPTSVSLKHLRNALWRLRHLTQSVGASVDDYLVITDRAAWFSPSGRYWLDIEDFEATTLRFADLSGRELAPDQARELEAVVDLYSGDLLDGLYDDWCLYDRERLRLLHSQALTKLMAFHEFNSTCERALDFGRRILSIDITRESVHRSMIRLYGLQGDRVAAMAQYRRCAEILRDTLNVAPMEDTSGLYQQIVQGQLPDKMPPSADAESAGQGHGGERTESLTRQARAGLQRLQVVLDEASAELVRISRVVDELETTQKDASAPQKRRLEDGA